jgi:hypothetical protein
MAMTNYLSNALANAVVRNTSYTSPATVYCALYSTAPTASTSGTELSGSNYSRQAVTFSAPVAGVATSNVAVTFGAASANWTAAVALAITDASTSGNILYFKTITTQVVLSGSSLTIASGDITVTMT